MEYDTGNGKVVFESLWQTRQRNLVPVIDMDDEHIMNTIDYLERKMVGLQDEVTIPILDADSTRHNIEVLKRELVRRG